MAPQRKPDDERQDKRESRQSLTLASRGMEAPEPSPAWNPETRSQWVAFWSSDLCSVIDAVSLPVLKRLYNLRDVQARLLEEWEDEPWIEGSTGQKKISPAFTEATKLEASITALEDRLGISPKAKANLGIAVGQAALTVDDLNRRAKEQAELPDGFTAFTRN